MSRALDRALLEVWALAADAVLLLLRTLAAVLRLAVDGRRAVSELDRTVVNALPLVVLTGTASGAVMVWQTEEGLARLGASIYVAKIVALSLVRELGPVMVGLLMAGRAGSAMAAELGSMAISEQLAAMRALSLDWMRFLVAPRVLALTVGVPCLVLAFDLCGLAGGYLVGVLDRGIASGSYLAATHEALRVADLRLSLLKGLVFGMLLSAIGCRMGLAVDPKSGAAGVGHATTAAVVAGSVAVLLADAIVTRLIVGGGA